MPEKLLKYSIVILAAVTAGLYLLYTLNIIGIERKEQQTALVSDEPNQITAEENQDQDQPTTTTVEEQQPDEEKNTNNQVEIPDTSTADTQILKISNASQSNGTINVSARGKIAESGDCVYNFTSSDTRPIAKEGVSQTDSDEQVCDIAVNEVEFTKLGKWDIEIIFTNQDDTYKATGEIDVQ